METTTATAPATAYAIAPSPHMRPEWRATAGAYLAEVAQRTGSTRTPVEYGRLLGRFLTALPDPATASPANVHAFAYLPGPSGKEPSPSTIAVRLAAVAGFYDFARRMGQVATNPATDVRRPRNRAATPKGLTPDELRALLDAIPTESPSGLRDRAIILTAILTGLRRTEVMGLRWGDLTRNGTIYYTARTKGGTVRHRELPLPAFAAILATLEAEGRDPETLETSARLFGVSGQGFYANLARYARRAGLEGVTPHVLRHSAAKLRRDAGATIEEVQSLLGHANLATTARYLARLEGERDTGWQRAAALLGV